jgi:hypothetical protein
MAQQWLRLIGDPHNEDNHLDEGRLLLRVLEAERERQGSAWSDLYFRVQKGLSSISTDAKRDGLPGDSD